MNDSERDRFLNRCTVDPDSIELDRSEEAIFMASKSGSLFEPDMDEDEWQAFCEAAEKEQLEREAKTPAEWSQLTAEDRERLTNVAIPRNPGVRKVLKRRRELVTRARPQSIDPEGLELANEIARDIEDAFGLSADEWGQIDTTLGA